MTTRYVYKYPFELVDEQVLELPLGAEILKVDRQGATVQLWALVKREAPPVSRRFLVRGTGHPITADRAAMDYVGSFYYGHADELVFHVFEVRG